MHGDATGFSKSSLSLLRPVCLPSVRLSADEEPRPAHPNWQVSETHARESAHAGDYGFWMPEGHAWSMDVLLLVPSFSALDNKHVVQTILLPEPCSAMAHLDGKPSPGLSLLVLRALERIPHLDPI